MKRASLHRWTLWLLPLLLARAFVPAGFMLSADASGLSLTFCTTISAASGATSHTGHHDHAAHHAAHPDDGSEAQRDGANSCPFAVASTGVSYEWPVLAAEPLPDLYVLTLDSTLLSGHQPLRSGSIRGPPAFA